MLYTFLKFLPNFMLYRCLLKNKYGAVISAISPALLFLCVFMLVLVRLYQSSSWKVYDDIYAGRLNTKGFVIWFIVSLKLKCLLLAKIKTNKIWLSLVKQHYLNLHF